ncbi:MAG: Rrf2 family transcriptional regulator [Gammaproteobacteria bacterium]|nr:Rrf2 family transcriptional regulator [Gammaproteobacteria bacterium]MDH5735210.1 Rrf2 family transcriptional regulator [Gammaproteobacteria bacterium]
MRLTSKGRYAVTAVLDLSFHQNEGPVSLADISARQEISLSYLEQLFARLRRNKVVNSTRGPGGGYKLSRDPADISMAEIILAVDETYDATACGSSSKPCSGNYQCLTHDLWQELSQEIHTFLKEITLAEMMSKRTVREVADRQDRVVQTHELKKVVSVG